jgi:opacity protein-like surface antigen
MVKISNLSAILALLLCTLILASPISAQQFYAEGQIARTQAQDVDSSTSTSSGLWSAVATGSFEYDPSIEYGIELGVRAIGGTRFRAGLSYSQFEAEFVKGTVSAALSYDGSVLVSGSDSFTRADLEGLGLTFDNKVKVYSLNGYYDFKAGKRVAPYLGLGIGLSDIENANDKELTLSGYAGVNYNVTEKLYLGIRGTIRRVAGPTDTFDVKYDDVTAWSIGAVFGVKL